MRTSTLVLLVVASVQVVVLVIIANWQLELVKSKYFFENNVPPEVPRNEETRGKFLSYWRAGLNSIGAYQTYEKFRVSYVSQSAFTQHSAAHYFGNLLFEDIGEEGLYVCDKTYSWGCYHAMISHVLAEKGEGEIVKLDKFCGGSVGCLHGIGHGIVGYTGYDIDSLIIAIDLCRSVKSPDPVDGCLGGVFMEYNERTMLRVEGVLPRPLPESVNADEECDPGVVGEAAQKACYFWLAQWLTTAEEGSLREKFSSAAAGCFTANNLQNRLLCYSGLGYELIGYTTDPKEARSLCDSVADNSKDPYFYVQCVSSAAAGFAIDSTARPYANLICDRLTKNSELSYCTRASASTWDKRIEVFKAE